MSINSHVHVKSIRGMNLESCSSLVKDMNRSTATVYTRCLRRFTRTKRREENGSLISNSSQSAALTQRLHKVCPHSTSCLALSNTHTNCGNVAPIAPAVPPLKDAGHLVGRHTRVSYKHRQTDTTLREWKTNRWLSNVLRFLPTQLYSRRWYLQNRGS